MGRKGERSASLCGVLAPNPRLDGIIAAAMEKKLEIDFESCYNKQRRAQCLFLLLDQP